MKNNFESLMQDFCLKCGKREWQQKDNHLLCLACGFEKYQNPINGVCCGIYFKEGSDYYILLVQRAKDPNKDSWQLPGGFMEIEEKLESGLVRELKEELGFEADADKLEYINSYPLIYPYKSNTYNVITVAFMYQIPSKIDFQVLDDIQDYKWVRLDKVDYETLCFEDSKNTIQKISKHLNSKNK